MHRPPSSFTPLLRTGALFWETCVFFGYVQLSGSLVYVLAEAFLRDSWMSETETLHRTADTTVRAQCFPSAPSNYCKKASVQILYQGPVQARSHSPACWKNPKASFDKSLAGDPWNALGESWGRLDEVLGSASPWAHGRILT